MMRIPHSQSTLYSPCQLAMAALVQLECVWGVISVCITRSPKAYPKPILSIRSSSLYNLILTSVSAFRCALDPRVSAAVTYFATDLHSATLGLGMKDDTLARCSEIKAELVMIHGTLDNHVPPEGRDLIRKTLREKGIVFSWYEPAGAQRKYPPSQPHVLRTEHIWKREHG
jgi:hypothetical protein